jgi:hypothetical protein
MKRIGLICAALLATYIGVAVSGLPEHIARHDPVAASYFRAPLFNFEATYTSGSVLNFHIGSNRGEFASALKRQYGASGVLHANCGNGAKSNTARNFVAVTDAERVPPILAKDLVCVSFEERGVYMFVSFSGDRVTAIRLDCVHTEGT